MSILGEFLESIKTDGNKIDVEEENNIEDDEAPICYEEPEVSEEPCEEETPPEEEKETDEDYAESE